VVGVLCRATEGRPCGADAAEGENVTAEYGQAELDQLSWIYAIAKAEGAVPGRPANVDALVRKLRTEPLSYEAGFYLGDFVERHKFGFEERHRPPRAKQRLYRWAVLHRRGLIATLQSVEPSHGSAARLAVLLRELKIEKVQGRPRVPAYLEMETDKKLKLAAEEYRAQLQLLGVAREEALRVAADRHGLTVEAVRAYVDQKSSKRRR
jgi:hypothetical protein